MNIPKPSDINIQEHLWGCFGNVETEASAYWIIKLWTMPDGTIVK